MTLVAGLGALLPALAMSAGEQWVTPMQCGDAQARFTVSCSKAKSADQRNACKMPQKMEFIDKSGSVIKTLNVPVYLPGEAEKYKAAGTADEMFGVTWKCISTEGKDYFYLYYAADTGAARYNEKLELYTSSGEVVTDRATRFKIARTAGSSGVKDQPIKAATSE